MKSNSIHSLTANEQRLLMETLDKHGFGAALAKAMIDPQYPDEGRSIVHAAILGSGRAVPSQDATAYMNEENRFGRDRVKQVLGTGKGEEAAALRCGYSTASRYVPFCPFSPAALEYRKNSHALILMPGITLCRIVEIFPDFFIGTPSEIGTWHGSFVREFTRQGWHLVSRLPRPTGKHIARQLVSLLPEEDFASIAESVFMMILVCEGRSQLLEEKFGSGYFATGFETHQIHNHTFFDAIDIKIEEGKIRFGYDYPDPQVIATVTPFV